MFVREQRVDLEFLHLVQIAGQLGKLDESQGDRIEVRWSSVAIAFELLIDTRARDHLARERKIERRKPEGIVLDHFE